MADPNANGLDGKSILVVEDQYFLADEVRRALLTAGATVVGPVAEIAEALLAAETHPGLNGAVLDINLRGEPAYAVADALVRHGVPIVFTTGYDKAAVREAYQNVARCQKPIDVGKLIRLLTKVMAAERPAIT